jgi:hypothetical protein
MAGPTITSHPAGAGRTTGRRPSSARRPAARRPSPTRRKAVAGRRRAKGGRSRKSRRTRSWDVKRWWPVLVIAAAVLVGVAWDRQQETALATAEKCTVADSSVTVTPEQMQNAKIIADVAHSRGLPDRAIVIALATAQQESRLRNLDYGDRDSLGLFQQRPSSGWGSPAQVQDPIYAAGKFYDKLVQIPNWDTGALTKISQRVQRSGFPNAYAQWEGMATAITASLNSGTLRCD